MYAKVERKLCSNAKKNEGYKGEFRLISIVATSSPILVVAREARGLVGLIFGPGGLERERLLAYGDTLFPFDPGGVTNYFTSL